MDFGEDAWEIIEDEVGFIEIDKEKIDEDKSFFNETEMKDQVYNILVTRYENVAYNKKKSRKFDIKVKNFVRLFEGVDDQGVGGAVRDQGIPVIQAKVNAVSDDYKAANNTWISSNSEQREWIDFLRTWHDIRVNSSAYVDTMYDLFSPYVPNDMMTPNGFDSDALNKIIKSNDDAMFSRGGVLGPHPYTNYPGDHVEVIGRYVDTNDNDNGNDTVVFDITEYRKALSQLREGDSVIAYPHDYLGIKGSHKVKRIIDGKVHLSNGSVFDAVNLSQNTFLIWPQSIPSSKHISKLTTDKNTIYIFDEEHDMSDQLAFTQSTPSQMLFKLIEKEPPSLYHTNTVSLAHKHPILHKLHGNDASVLNMCVERAINSFSQPRPLKLKNKPTLHKDQKRADHILKKLPYPHKDTFLDEPIARFRYLLGLADHGMSVWYKSIIKDLKAQKAGAAINVSKKQPGVKKKVLTSFPSSPIDEVIKFDFKFDSIKDALEHAKGRDGQLAIVKTAPIIIMKWSEGGWDVADVDEYPRADGYIIDLQRNVAYKEQEIVNAYNALKDGLLLETTVTESDISNVERAIELFKEDRNNARIRKNPWRFIPADNLYVDVDSRLFEGGNDSDDDDDDIIAGEGFGIAMDRIEKDEADKENHELLERIKNGKKDDHIAILDDLTQFIEEDQLTQEEKRMVIGYIDMYHNKADIITRLRSQKFANRTEAATRIKEELELTNMHHYLVIMAFFSILRPTLLDISFVPHIMKHVDVFSSLDTDSIARMFTTIHELVLSRCNALQKKNVKHDLIRADMTSDLQKVWETFRPAVGKKASGAAAFVLQVVDVLGKKRYEELKDYGKIIPLADDEFAEVLQKRPLASRPLKLIKRRRLDQSKSTFLTYAIDFEEDDVETLDHEKKGVEYTKTVRIRKFMIANRIFTGDANLETLTQTYDWDTEFQAIVEGENTFIMELLREARIDTKEWLHFYNTFTLLNTNIDPKTLRDCLYFFTQGVFGKLISRSFNDYKIPTIRKKFLKDHAKRITGIYLNERERMEALRGSVVEPLLPAIEQILEDGLKDLSHLRLEDEDAYHNINLILYVFLRCMRWILQSVLIETDDVFSYSFPDEYEFSDDIEGTNAAKVFVDLLMREFMHTSNTYLVNLENIDKKYEAVREERKQDILRKMNLMNNNTKRLYLNAKQKGLTQFMKIDELTEKNAVIDDDDEDEDDGDGGGENKNKKNDEDDVRPVDDDDKKKVDEGYDMIDDDYETDNEE